MIITWVDSTGTFTLDDTNGIDVLEGATGLDLPPVSVAWEQRVTFDGAGLVNERFEARQILLPLFFYDAAGNGRDKVAAFGRRLLLAGSAGGELRVTQDGRTRSLFQVRRTAGLEGLETPIGNWRQMPVELTAGDPWWYGAEQLQELVLGGETTFDDAAVDFDDVATPFDGGDSTLVLVDGDTVTYPWFTVTGPFTDLSVTSSTTGQSWQLARPLAAGEVLTVDSRPGRRGPLLTGAVRQDWSWVTNRSRMIELRAGSNSFAVGSDGTTGDSKVELRWRSRFATS